MEKNHPTFDYGKICYIEIPAVDIVESVLFYHEIFGWTIRKREDGKVCFDEGLTEVSGAWLLDRKPVAKISGLISTMVNDSTATFDRIVASSGKVVQPIGKDLPGIIALFSAPAGNT